MHFLKDYLEKPKKLFGFLYWNFFFGYLPFGVLAAILSLLGKVPANFNEQEVYGMLGFSVHLFFVFALPFLISFFCWIYICIGNFIINYFLKDKNGL
jgi:hypothetical protein